MWGNQMTEELKGSERETLVKISCMHAREKKAA